jgi:hypothetical protein
MFSIFKDYFFILSVLKNSKPKSLRRLIISCLFSILLDWKGCGKAEKRQEIINLLKDLGLELS